MLLLLLSLSPGCRSRGSIDLPGDSVAPARDSGGERAPSDSAPDSAPDTGGDTAPQEPPDPGDAAWCVDWEDGSLLEAGYEGGYIELFDGAILTVVEEGTSWSALTGEQALDLRGDRALVLRSNRDGAVESVAIATTRVFEVDAPELWWWALSEVDARGVTLYADLLDDAGRQLASLDVPVETGGFLPTLRGDAELIEEIPELGYEGGQPGALTRQVLDLSPYQGQRLKLRLYQHTRVEGSAFFTLVDDLCVGQAHGEEARLEWGEPDPTHLR